jgi:glycosyltransferase involved in cell wall biosynthesis
MLKTLKHAFSILRQGRFKSSGLPWLREHGVPLPMSLEAYAFDRYKRARKLAVPCRDLRRLKVSCQPGLVSVVLPVYNGAKHLNQALNSLLAQTYPDWELIAVDDGSTDESGAILDEFAAREPAVKRAGERVRVIHQPNQKLPGALNTGFHLVRGEFLTWISDDNCLYPAFLARLVDCLQRHPDWDMAYGNEDVIGEDGEPLLDSPWFRGNQRPLGSAHIHLPADTCELNTVDNNTIGAAFLYRRRVLELLGDYDPSRYGAEDYDYWMRANTLLTLRHADDAKGRLLAEPLLAYRFHGHSLTSREAELGTRQARTELLRWDDFRRDFYLTPLIWRLAYDETPQAKELAGELRQQIERAGHIILSGTQFDLPCLWFPVILLRLMGSHADGSKLDVLGTEGRYTIHLDGIQDADMLFTVADIWTRVRHLERLQAEIADPPPPRYRLSVVICTYRRGDQLEQAVASVVAQTLPPFDFELLIVNNAPEDESLLPRVDSLRARYFTACPERLRLVVCPHLGLSYARNAGLAEAQGEIICYLDDDAVAEPDWLECIQQAFEQHPQAGVVGGYIVVRKPDRLPRWWLPGSEVHWSGFTPSYPAYTEVAHWSQYPNGANWCARRKVLLGIGGFRTRYGRRGPSYMSSEEILAAELIRKAGYAVGIEPRARVTHQVDPSRFTLRHVRGMLLGGRQGWYQAQMDLYFPWELGLRNTLRRIGKAIWPPSRRALVRTPYMLYTEARMATWYLFDLARRFRRPAVRS